MALYHARSVLSQIEICGIWLCMLPHRRAPRRRFTPAARPIDEVSRNTKPFFVNTPRGVPSCPGGST